MKNIERRGEKMHEVYCYMCGKEGIGYHHDHLYVNGSEGCFLCIDCCRKVCEFIRKETRERHKRRLQAEIDDMKKRKEASA